VFTEARTVSGTTVNISLGGVLILCSDPFPSQTAVRVDLTLPHGYRLECSGTVVHSQPSTRMAIQFQGLNETARDAILSHVQQFKVQARRSNRISRQIQLEIEWHDAQGARQKSSAQTLVLSRYGALIACEPRLKVGDEILVCWPERQRSAYARVVFRRLAGAGQQVDLAFEFSDDANFWDIEFGRDFLDRQDDRRDRESASGPHVG